jgi:hypothetical protein
MVFFCHSKGNWLHHVVSKKQHKRPMTSNINLWILQKKKLFWMNCKHDFQIKQRITNRNSLLEYDIRNIVAMVREPIPLIKLLEDFYISTICHSYENIGNGKFPWISRSLLENMMFLSSRYGSIWLVSNGACFSLHEETCLCSKFQICVEMEKSIISKCIINLLPIEIHSWRIDKNT